MAISVVVAGHELRAGTRPFVIAEAGVNHNGDLGLALELVAAAADAGADAVKFQTFSAERVVVAGARAAEYAGGGSQRELLCGLELPPDAWVRLKVAAEGAGLVFLSTPFDERAVDLLADLRLAAMKVSSGDLTNTPLLRRIARTGLPVLLSCGMSSLEEVRRGLQDLGDAPVVLLHCVSAYPAPLDDCHLAVIPELTRHFGVPVGFSDHTEGEVAAITAVALGACCIEKHLTLDRGLPGPDHQASMPPDSFGRLVRAIRSAHAAVGDAEKCPRPSEADTSAVARRSLVSASDIPRGTLLGPDDVAARRPAGGIPPTSVDDVTGRRLRRGLAEGEPFAWDDLEAFS